MKKHLSFQSRNAWVGRAFLSLWVIGVVMFFILPFIKTLLYSFSTIRFQNAGMTVELEGLSSYIRMFTKDADFLPKLSWVFGDMLVQLPVIVMFSLFAAVLLNMQFRGRLVFRTIFFLPVIVMSGVIISLIQGEYTGNTQLLAQADSSGQMFTDITVLNDLLGSFGFGNAFISVLTDIVSQVIDVCWRSGVQILLFLAALQGIPSQLYEAASIEGATKWEAFWKITFPMSLPVLYLTIVYTVIESFTAADNEMMEYIQAVSFNKFDYAYGSAIAMVYCVAILLIVGLITLLMRRWMSAGDR